MPFWGLIAEEAFSPEDLKVLIAAYEGTCKELGREVSSDGSTDDIAKAVIRIGKRHMDDAAAIQNRALMLLRNTEGNSR